VSRFSTPEQAKAAAELAAADDHRRHLEYGIDLNPFCTQGARNDWQRGFDNAGSRSYESPTIVLWDTIYCAAELLLRSLKG